MALIFHERVGHEGRRPSPFSWRIRYALAHKGLDFEVRPTRFADVETIRALSGQQFTPVVVDDGQVIHETWNIATHLEDRNPGKPSLFGSPEARGMARFVNVWSDTVLLPAIRPLFIADFPKVLDAGDRAYFRTSREEAMGRTLEEACADRPKWLAAFENVCAPLERTLGHQAFIAGGRANYADFVVFSIFQMARLGSPHEILREGSAIRVWRSRMIALHDNLGDRFAGYPT